MKSAKGTKGILIKNLNGSFSFRVYNDDKSDFTDYKIAHHDLEIEIQDDDAVFRDELIVGKDFLGRDY